MVSVVPGYGVCVDVNVEVDMLNILGVPSPLDMAACQYENH